MVMCVFCGRSDKLCAIYNRAKCASKRRACLVGLNGSLELPKCRQFSDVLKSCVLWTEYYMYFTMSGSFCLVIHSIAKKMAGGSAMLHAKPTFCFSHFRADQVTKKNKTWELGLGSGVKYDVYDTRV